MTEKKLTFGSLFAGVGGIDLGFERAGMECKWQVEIDPAANLVLEKHWPDVGRFEDVCKVGAHNLEPVDVIAGGFPCQDVSVAGARAGLDGKRSILWDEYARIIRELRPRWVLAENVRGLYTANDGRFFSKVLRDLAAIGYDAEWDCIPAAFFGAPQLRYRVYIVAYPQRDLGDRPGHVYFYSQNRSDVANCVKPPAEGTWNGIRIDRTRAATYLERFPQPLFYGVDHGVPDGLDKSAAAQRMKQMGNAVVPQAAEWLGRRIVEVDKAWWGGG